jgi:hypothetical protein
MLGLLGPEAQEQIIQQIKSGPQFKALERTGEEAILHQASATGGLRGGNVQQALAQYRPEILSKLLEQRYQRLGGMTKMGQQSAAGVGATGMDMATQISGLLADRGAARAGRDLAVGKTQAQLWGIPGQTAGFIAGKYPEIF